jgi:nucleoside 2-deoxyribosyltransferase
MRRPKIYLAGPEVFLPNAIEIARIKNQLTTEAGFLPLNPLDNNLGKPPELRAERERFADLIFQANFEMIYECDAIIANLTPFRGISADVGTAVEAGMGIMGGKKVFGYTNSSRDYCSRCEMEIGGRYVEREDGDWIDIDGCIIERFGLMDNIMVDRGVRRSGGYDVHRNNGLIDDLTSFKVCLGYARYVLLNEVQ